MDDMGANSLEQIRAFLNGSGNVLICRASARRDLWVAATSHESAEHRTYVEASPISFVTPDDPPFLLMHGDRMKR